MAHFNRAPCPRKSAGRARAAAKGTLRPRISVLEALNAADWRVMRGPLAENEVRAVRRNPRATMTMSGKRRKKLLQRARFAELAGLAVPERRPRPLLAAKEEPVAMDVAHRGTTLGGPSEIEVSLE